MAKINTLTNNQCHFVALGDMNSRIGQLQDFVQNDDINIYVDVLPDDYQPDRPMSRVSQDTVTNQNGS